MKKFRIGIALGGGGARGFAHLGVLKALNEKGIYPEIISGVSAGTLAGAFIASGKTPEETLDIMRDKRMTDYVRVGYPRNGLLRLDNLQKFLEDKLEIKEVEKLTLPFIIACTNLNTGKAEYMEKGTLVDLVKASMAIPILISPVIINKNLYVDGGLIDNLPVKPLVGRCKNIIGVNISPVHEVNKLDGLIEIATRSFQLGVNNNLEEMKALCDLFIQPEGLEDYGILQIDKADELYELGYEYVRNLDFKI